MSRSFGTGQPTNFQCSRCRRNNIHFNTSRQMMSTRGMSFDVKLTGRTRPEKQGGAYLRSTDTAREYRCLTCGHVGWSRHIQLKYKAEHEGKVES